MELGCDKSGCRVERLHRNGKGSAVSSTLQHIKPRVSVLSVSSTATCVEGLFDSVLAMRTALTMATTPRIEDTDLARSTKESEEMVLADLKWLGIEWDEGECPGSRV